MKSLYESEVQKEVAKHSSNTNDIITEKDIVHLPEPVQKYFRHCCYLGKQKMINAQVEWEDVYLKTAPNKKWMSLQCNQFNSVPEPTRIAYMKNSILGILPFEGRDKYQDGHANMLIKLVKFKVADVKGKEMDQSGLVTILAEALFIPAYALQDYIEWTAVDANTVKAVLRYKGSEVSGLFYFNDHGEFIRFETHDRFYYEKGTDYKKVKWSGVAGDYIERNGIRYISQFRAIWNLPEGDYEYFKGNIKAISYNIK